MLRWGVTSYLLWKCTNSKNDDGGGSRCRVTNPAPTQKGSKESEYSYWVLWIDMKSIWKSSEIFLLISVELHSKARRQNERKKKNYWIQTVWTPVSSRRTDKMSFDPKQKLNKGPKYTMIKEITILGNFSGGGGILSLVWKFWQRWL